MINYMQVKDMTDEELLKVYMKLPKKEIAGMLIQCNKILKAIKPIAVPLSKEGWKQKKYPKLK